MGKKQKVKAAMQSHIAPDPPQISQNDSLLDDLLAQMDRNNPIIQQGSSTTLQEVQQEQISQTIKKSSKTRFKEREARRNAAMAANYGPTDPEAEAQIQAETKAEEEAISKACKDHNLQMHEINPDGHCLYSAIADQLILLSIIPPAQYPYMVTRNAAADFILSHPDDFIPFLPSPEGEDGQGATESGMMTQHGLQRYCNIIRNSGAWGGEPEITALARAYRVPIQVFQWGNPPVVVHSPETGAHPSGQLVRISYHRRMYGLGEHYNSLRPQS